MHRSFLILDTPVYDPSNKFARRRVEYAAGKAACNKPRKLRARSRAHKASIEAVCSIADAASPRAPCRGSDLAICNDRLSRMHDRAGGSLNYGLGNVKQHSRNGIPASRTKGNQKFEAADIESARQDDKRIRIAMRAFRLR
jgi:hypothetical protein